MRKSLLSLTAVAACVTLTAAAPADRSTRAAERAARDAAAFQKEIVGLTPGKPLSCLPISRQSLPMKGIGSKLVYRDSRKLVYVSEAPGCEGVGRGDVLVTRQFTGRACRGDIAQTVDRVARFPTGSCALGEFTPYRAK